MFLILCTITTLTLTLAVSADLPVKPCIPRSMCSCENADGLYDLHPLADHDGTPRFHDIPDPDGKTFYSWNPCNGFDEQDCKDVAVCKITELGSSSISLGPQNSLKYISSSQYGIMFQYTQWGGNNNSGVVILTCNETIEGIVVRRPDADFLNEIYLELISKHACPKKVNRSTTAEPSTTRRKMPTTPAFIGTAWTPSTTPPPLLGVNTLSWLVIAVIGMLLVLLMVTIACFFTLHSRISGMAPVPSQSSSGYGSAQQEKQSLLPRV